MIKDVRYKGIVFMLMAALCFSMMGGAAKALKEVFSAGQLVLYRNAIGMVFLIPGLLIKPPVQTRRQVLAACIPWIDGSTCFIHIIILYSASSLGHSDEL